MLTLKAFWKIQVFCRNDFFDKHTTGLQKKRFIDIAAVSGDLIVEMHQVGKVNKNGLPVKRERDVIQEIKNELDIDIIFHPYNKTAGDNYENESD